MSIRVLYRISDKGRPKEKIPTATKKHCLENAIAVFGLDKITLFADNCEDSTLEMIRSLGLDPISIQLGNSGSFRHVAKYALDKFEDTEIVYFLEDDYLHLNHAAQCILEGIQIADYVTLYDHPDKYVNARQGGNPFVRNGGEATRVLLTESSHWKQTNSTTMTFACRVGTLKSDYTVWHRFTSEKTPKDFKAFKRLQGIGIFNKIAGKRRILISPVPTIATHAEVEFLAPLVDWSNV